MTGPDANFATRTTTKLLDALRDLSNEPAWAHLDARYRPVIRGLARRLGAGESDAEEVAQQTLVEFVRAYREGRYDRAKGRLSSWILGIAHHTTLAVFRRAGRPDAPPGRGAPGGAPGGSEGGTLSGVQDEAALRTVWDDERDRVILERAMAMLRDESEVDDRTLTAFELCALRGVPASEAAAQCGMSTEQVYVAKSRVTKRLRALVQELTTAFEEDA